jgi:hypothetical protein
MGKITITKEAGEKLSFWRFKDIMHKYLNCDWGIVPDSDKQKNDNSVKIGDGRIFACYRTLLGHKFWIITDNQTTTISLPGEKSKR